MQSLCVLHKLSWEDNAAALTRSILQGGVIIKYKEVAISSGVAAMLLMVLSAGGALATYPGPDADTQRNNNQSWDLGWAESSLKGHYNTYGLYQNVEIWSSTGYTVDGLPEGYWVTPWSNTMVWYRGSNWDIGLYHFPQWTPSYYSQASNIYSEWVAATTIQDYSYMWYYWSMEVHTVEATAYIQIW